MFVNGGSEYVRLLKLQRQAMFARDKLDVAATEMTTGLKASRYEATGGNLTRLLALERSLDRNAIYRENLALTELRLDVMQDAYGQMLKPAESLAINLTNATGLNDYKAAMLHASNSRDAFLSTVGLLNTQVAGQSLFAGARTDAPALIDGEAILAELQTALASAGTAADALATIDAYFAPGGGFSTTAYTGSTDDLTAVDTGEGQRIDYGRRADEERTVALLRAHATAAVVADGALPGNQTERMALLSAAAARTLDAKEGLIGLRSEVGMQQEQVASAQAARTAEKETLTMARAEIVAVDPLEAASAYQQLEVLLESVYTVTARISSLRFSNFMP